MSFEEVPSLELDKDSLLWRYMDLHRFIYLISKKKLFFSRLDQFDDPFEGVTKELIAARYSANRIPSGEHLNPSFSDEERTSILKTKEDTLANYEIQALAQQKTQFVNCWFSSKREAMAMWNIYSNPDSIAISFNRSNLIEYFRTIIPTYDWPNHLFICGSVGYQRINPPDFYHKVDDVIYSALKKDETFDFEKEYRFLIVTLLNLSESNPTFLEIELSQTIFTSMRVICHPKMEEWKFKNIQTLCGMYQIGEPEKSKIELK